MSQPGDTATLADDAYLREFSDEELARGAHRDFVGGLWREVGTLQLEFLRVRGLETNHRLLDIGCGALRGGVHFVAYLEPGHYYGIDCNSSLLRAGREIELPEASGEQGVDLTKRLPAENLLCDDRFAFDRFGVKFDMAIAQSLFTHIDRAAIRRCLEALAPCTVRGALLYASFFERPAGHAGGPLVHGSGEVTTLGNRDPYHYRLSDIEACASELPFSVRLLGDWGHPRGQRMLELARR